MNTITTEHEIGSLLISIRKPHPHASTIRKDVKTADLTTNPHHTFRIRPSLQQRLQKMTSLHPQRTMSKSSNVIETHFAQFATRAEGNYFDDPGLAAFGP